MGTKRRSAVRRASAAALAVAVACTFARVPGCTATAAAVATAATADTVVASSSAAAPVGTFPLPQSIALGSSARPLAPGFKIRAASTTSPHLDQVIARYDKFFTHGRHRAGVALADKAANGAPAAAAAPVAAVSVEIQTASAALDNTTNTSYSISLPVGADTVVVAAHTSYGAMYGLETLTQLLTPSGDLGDGAATGGSLPDTIAVEDHPSVGYRGLTLDVGRRISPVALLENTVQAMSYTKMNVLHLSLSGPVVRLQIEAYPELTEGLTAAQYYTQQQMKDFVAFAQSYGVRVIPEIDIPAHASGLRPLRATRGLSFCDGAAASTVGATTANLQCLQTIFDELVSVFPDPWVHFGGDEVAECANATASDCCTVEEVRTVESAVQQRLMTTHGRTPVGWNEVYSVPAASVPNAAVPGSTVLQNWKGATNAATTAAGFLSIDSTYEQFYLNEQCCRVVPPSATADPFGRYSSCYWVDVLAGLSRGQQQFMAGGAAAMWSDNYCPAPVCAINGTYGWMYPPEQDDVFTQSFSKSIWPNAAAAGAAFWNFDATVAVTPEDLQLRLAAHNSRLLARGVTSCANNCTCDWGSECGKPYGGRPTPLNVEVTLVNEAGAQLTLKERTPCDKRNGANILKIAQGDTGVVKGKNFIAEAGGGLASDPFNLWIGDGTWMNLNLTLRVTNAGGGYLAFTIVE